MTVRSLLEKLFRGQELTRLDSSRRYTSSAHDPFLWKPQFISRSATVAHNWNGSHDDHESCYGVTYVITFVITTIFPPPISLSGKNASVAAFTAPTVVGNVNANSYLFELTVTDNDGLMDTATSKIVVEKSPIR
jgi:hypothetical protein